MSLKKYEEFIYNYAKNNFKEIDVCGGKLRLNRQCHRNSVHDAIKNGDESIVLCICKDKNSVYVHFINKTDGKFIDNTFGY